MKNRINTLVFSLLMVFASALMSSNQALAQDNPIYQLPDDPNTSRRATASTIVDYPEDLLYELEPSIYVKNNAIIETIGANSPKVLKLKDVNSFNLLNTRNSLFRRIEMITINISSPSDLTRSFNVDNIRGFGQLKYIYIKSDFVITENQIRTFIQNADPEISIFYKIFNRS